MPTVMGHAVNGKREQAMQSRAIRDLLTRAAVGLPNVLNSRGLTGRPDHARNAATTRKGLRARQGLEFSVRSSTPRCGAAHMLPVFVQ